MPHDLESCVTNFSIWGFQLSLSSSITPRYVKLLCFDIGWWLIEIEKLIFLRLFMSKSESKQWVWRVSIETGSYSNADHTRRIRKGRDVTKSDACAQKTHRARASSFARSTTWKVWSVSFYKLFKCQGAWNKGRLLKGGCGREKVKKHWYIHNFFSARSQYFAKFAVSN